MSGNRVKEVVAKMADEKQSSQEKKVSVSVRLPKSVVEKLDMVGLTIGCSRSKSAEILLENAVDDALESAKSRKKSENVSGDE
ncbi:MAG: hypothetical protein HQL69_19385 [Magnetococcales bacterium]|nr:hypothetical protein [Magnetococcales bacterium]